MLGLQGEGGRTRDPFQFGDQELGSHTYGGSGGQGAGQRDPESEAQTAVELN